MSKSELRNAAMKGDAAPEFGGAAWLESQDFYELCQAYRHAKDWPHEGMQTVAEAFEELKREIRKHAAPAALPEGYVRVPKDVVERAAVMLQAAAECGIDAHHPDGRETRNAVVCRETADVLLAAAQGERK